MISIPPAVAAIYRSPELLRLKYPKRSFTLDGHLVGDIGEVIAAENFGSHC